MKNKNAEKFIDDCDADLQQVKAIVDALGPFSNVVPYLTKYSIVRACGSIETSYKTIIADFGESKQTKQVKNFINTKIRNSSSNPKLDAICRTLKVFDEVWNDDFKKTLNADADSARIKDSLQSLVDARNEFSHGGNPTLAFGDVYKYFNDSSRVIECLDSAVK